MSKKYVIIKERQEKNKVVLGGSHVTQLQPEVLRLNKCDPFLIVCWCFYV